MLILSKSQLIIGVLFLNMSASAAPASNHPRDPYYYYNYNQNPEYNNYDYYCGYNGSHQQDMTLDPLCTPGTGGASVNPAPSGTIGPGPTEPRVGITLQPKRERLSRPAAKSPRH